MQKTNSSPEAKAELEELERVKKRAARQAAKRELAPEAKPVVECVVLPMGDGKISMGQHIAGIGEAHYEEGETFTVELPVALNLYIRGYVNFEGAKQALADAHAGKAAEESAERAAKAAQQKALEAAGLA